ncbi:MAG: tetratricopeptide repeat protein [Nitrospinota bacterium]|jgi:tetratricopeptide (TPR) repeat protein|nr:tetratricopeptide repeat protein [Nitrospinota bacterium]HJM43124.1 tetratricopeptide repeat protein [Nitrospinota bacterium]
MRILAAICLLFAVLGASHPVAPFAEEAPACRSALRWEAAARRLTSDAKLISLLGEAAVECPGNLPIASVLGKILLERNHPEAAAGALRAGLARTPGLIEALLSASEAEAALKNHRRAIHLLSVARAIGPDHPRVRAFFEDLRNFLPLSIRREEGADPMLRVFFEGRHAKERLRKNPLDKEAQRRLAAYLLAQARALVETGETEQAEELLGRVLRRTPRYRPAREAMVERIIEGGNYHFRGENYVEALKRYREAARMLSDSVAAQIRIAEALQQIPGKREESRKAYLKARALMRSSADRASEEDRAEYTLAIAQGLTYVDPNHPLYRRRAARQEVARAERVTKQGRLKEAVQAYLKALEWTPDDGGIHSSLADTLRYVADGWRPAIRHYGLAAHHLKSNPPDGVDAEKLKALIRHAEREGARLEKSHTGTLAYIRAKFFLILQERRLEAIFFLIVFGFVLVLLWRSKTSEAED